MVNSQLGQESAWTRETVDQSVSLVRVAESVPGPTTNGIAAVARRRRMYTEIAFWPSMYEGGLPLQAYVGEHEYYVVSSTQVPRSSILDITAAPLAATGQYIEVASAQIDLEKQVFSTTDNLANVRPSWPMARPVAV